MEPRKLSSKIIPHTAKDTASYDGLFDDVDAKTKSLNVVMGSIVLLDVLDKAKGSVALHDIIKGEIGRLREAIGAFSDANEDESKEVAAAKRVARYAKKLVVAILYKPGLRLKSVMGSALDSAVLSSLLAMVDAGLHKPAWDAPRAVVIEQVKANRMVVEKMASLMADANDQKG
jgi:hypothetical protein